MSEKEKVVSKKSGGSYGVYIKTDDKTYRLHTGGFENSTQCERWIKKNIDALKIDEGQSLAILSNRKEIKPRVAVKKTVYLDEI